MFIKYVVLQKRLRLDQSDHVEQADTNGTRTRTKPGRWQTDEVSISTQIVEEIPDKREIKPNTRTRTHFYEWRFGSINVRTARKKRG